MSVNNILKTIRLLAGTLIGYLSLYMFLILTLEVMLGGNIEFHTASLPILILAGICAFGSALLAGMVGCLISGSWWRITPVLMSILSFIETTYLIQTEVLKGPLWFDMIAASNLAVGFFAGMLAHGYLIQKLRATRVVAKEATG